MLPVQVQIMGTRSLSILQKLFPARGIVFAKMKGQRITIDDLRSVANKNACHTSVVADEVIKEIEEFAKNFAEELLAGEQRGMYPTILCDGVDAEMVVKAFDGSGLKVKAVREGYNQRSFVISAAAQPGVTRVEVLPSED